MHTGYDIITVLAGGEKKLQDALFDALEIDEQTGTLLAELGSLLANRLNLSESDYDALQRFLWAVDHIALKKNPDAALLRNNVFKGANAAGLKLPSGSF